MQEITGRVNATQEVTLTRRVQEMNFTASLVDSHGMESAIRIAATGLPEQAEPCGDPVGFSRYSDGSYWPSMPGETPDFYRLRFTWWQDEAGARFMRDSEAQKIPVGLSHFRIADPTATAAEGSGHE